MKLTTNKLTGAALDWAVAKCTDLPFPIVYDEDGRKVLVSPSTDWSQGGPIIERAGIALYLYGDSEWNAHVGGRESVGPTPLIAAMRCHVAGQLGDEVDVPDSIALPDYETEGEE
jgi:hypothetical protein